MALIKTVSRWITVKSRVSLVCLVFNRNKRADENEQESLKSH